MGVWFDLYVKDNFTLSSSFQGAEISVFTFSIASLAGIATDYFFSEERTLGLKEKAALLMWVLSFIAVFLSLISIIDPYLGLFLTMAIWLMVKVESDLFTKANSENIKKLAGAGDSDFEGDGL